MMRYLKVIAALILGLIGSLAFLDNLFNISTAQTYVSAVISAPEQPFYRVIGPTFDSAWQGWLGLMIIMSGELVVGVLGFLGAIGMMRNRLADVAAFQAAKQIAVAGGAVGMIVWYGFFIVIGELYFNMWQTEIGLGSVNGAFRYGTVCALLMFFISMRND